MTTKTIQAPWVNFVIVTMTRTLKVIEAPMRLMIRLRMMPPRPSAPLRIRRIQCRTMPVWPRVNETNTPMM